MATTVTAMYSSPGQVKNAREDLIASGIPQEKIYADERGLQVKVITPETGQPEILEILTRHRPESTAAQ
jgi:hypothetical protein